MPLDMYFQMAWTQQCGALPHIAVLPDVGQFRYDHSVISSSSPQGKPLGQIWGLQAIGHFVDQADIDNSTPQQFGPVKPGDIKYKDVNNDGVINSMT